MSTQVVLAVDGGNSKTYLALLRADGTLLALVRGTLSSPHHLGVDGSLEVLARLLADAAREAGLPSEAPVADVGVFLLAGVDFPAEEVEIAASLEARRWAARTIVGNDTFAVLRAGTERSWGVGVVCGTGLNCCAVSPTGKIVRYAAIGEISGDGGGGDWMGLQALRAAIRGRDGRGPRTSLEQSVPAHFGLRTPHQLMEAIYLGTIDQHNLTELPRLVLSSSRAGDTAAQDIVDRLAGEIVAMVVSALRRLAMTRRDSDVVLGGGVARGRDSRLIGHIEQGVNAVAADARVHVLDAPPVLGASSSVTPASRSRTASCCETADGVNCSASATAAIVPRAASSRSSRRRRRSSIVK
jgi:N-acetylglucosamine kinase-like BadF-type ATPase